MNKKIEEIKMIQSGADGLDWFVDLSKIPRNLVTAMLYQFRDELEGNLVTYSKGKVSPWKFNKFPMSKWYTDIFERVEKAVEMVKKLNN